MGRLFKLWPHYSGFFCDIIFAGCFFSVGFIYQGNFMPVRSDRGWTGLRVWEIKVHQTLICGSLSKVCKSDPGQTHCSYTRDHNTHVHMKLT